MSKKLDRSLWQAVWGKKTRSSITPGQFESYLAQGASPWACYPGAGGRMRSVLEAICSGERADFEPMLSIWLNYALPLDPPPHHPSLVACLPGAPSLASVDKLLEAGMPVVQASDLAAFAQRGIDEDLLGSETFWATLEKLQLASGVRLSDISISGSSSRHDVLKSLCGPAHGRELPSRGLVFLLSDPQWDLEWTTSGDYQRWVQDFLVFSLRRNDSIPEILDEVGFDWLGVDCMGNNLAHLLSSKTIMNMDGKEVLPVNALLSCLERGVDLNAENRQQWTAVQRINLINWGNQDQLAPLDTELKRRALLASTPNAVNLTKSRRI